MGCKEPGKQCLKNDVGILRPIAVAPNINFWEKRALRPIIDFLISHMYFTKLVLLGSLSLNLFVSHRTDASRK
jgi:hypothetical protein